MAILKPNEMMTKTIPFKRVEAAGLHVEGNGCGDIPLSLSGEDRIAFLHLWPNVRPWRLARPEPSFTALNDLDGASAALVAGMKEVAPITVSAIAQTDGVRAAASGPARPEAAAA